MSIRWKPRSCRFAHSGRNANNIIPQTAMLRGTAQASPRQVRELLRKRVAEIAEGTARLYGATARATCARKLVLVNVPRQTAFAAEIAVT